MVINRIAKSLLILIIVIGSVALFLNREQVNIEELTHWVEGHYVTAVLSFILLYILLTALFFPSPLICLSAGILFGPVAGTLYSLIGATLSAVTSFSIGRYLAANTIERYITGELKELKQGVEKQGWRFIFMLRIVPGLPFTLFNYALGVTRISLIHFALTTAVCILPRVFFLNYAGYAGRRAVTGKELGIEPLLILLALGIAIASTYLFKRLKR